MSAFHANRQRAFEQWWHFLMQPYPPEDAITWSDILRRQHLASTAAQRPTSLPEDATTWMHLGRGAARHLHTHRDPANPSTLRLYPIEGSFTCPLTQEFMRDPVLTTDGQAYEKSYIDEWLDTRRQRTSPSTGLELASLHRLPLRAVKAAVEAYISARPEITSLFREHWEIVDTNARLSRLNDDLTQQLNAAQDDIAVLRQKLEEAQASRDQMFERAVDFLHKIACEQQGACHVVETATMADGPDAPHQVVDIYIEADSDWCGDWSWFESEGAVWDYDSKGIACSSIDRAVYKGHKSGRNMKLRRHWRKKEWSKADVGEDEAVLY